MIFPHVLTVVRDSFAAPNDDWNQPVAGSPTTFDVRGFLQSRAGREVRQANDQGAVASTHVAYLLPGADVTPADRLAFEGDTYQVRFVADARGLGGVAYRRADLFLVTTQ